MKNFINNKVYRFNCIGYLISVLLLISVSTALAADDAVLKKGDVTVDGLTVTKATRMT